MYVLTKREAEDVAALVGTKLGLSAAAYHAGLPHATRKGVHMAFLNDEVEVVVATVAFGMGIVRFC